jgi:hypothetical protein
VLDNYMVELGTQGKTLLCRIAERRGRGDTSMPIHREFDINPHVTLVGKASLDRTLCGWSPNELKI